MPSGLSQFCQRSISVPEERSTIKFLHWSSRVIVASSPTARATASWTLPWYWFSSGRDAGKENWVWSLPPRTCPRLSIMCATLCY
eukprot:5334902-Pyramimonas_sp.AAC.1